jgi:hypothetical protein
MQVVTALFHLKWHFLSDHPTRFDNFVGTYLSGTSIMPNMPLDVRLSLCRKWLPLTNTLPCYSMAFNYCPKTFYIKSPYDMWLDLHSRNIMQIFLNSDSFAVI